jgi:NAD(P)-dependent dehydrogenase (short-subunit alcohol dehydrogenase family)
MEKKIVFITGTSSGFGYLTAMACAEKGYTVYASMRNVEGKNANRAKELSLIPNINVVDVDITKTESVVNAISLIIEKEGRLDVVINNAGLYGRGLAEAFTEDDFEKMLDVNVKGTWRVIKACLPIMRKQGDGLIINTSSGLGRFSAPFMTIYNSSKFAVEGLTEGLHFELRSLGIDVVLIQPGAFATEIFGKLESGADQSIAAEYGSLAKIPQQIEARMEHMLKILKPNAQLIPQSILKLIETEKGARPLRTVIDPITGSIVEKANDQMRKSFEEFLTAFGLKQMMK